jgi:uncharacterized protein (DUF849 family)
MAKVILTCAVTGSIHTPSMSPYLPVTPDQIVADALGAFEAGASVLHLHARDPETGRPSSSPGIFHEFLPRIKQASDAVINITTGGGLGMTLDERLAAALSAKPELASMNMGSMNFNISGAAARVTEWMFDWEKPFLEGTADLIMSNTFGQIERGLREMGDNGTRFEFECYDIGHLYTLAHFADRKLAQPPFFIQGVFGILGGIGAQPAHLLHMRETADRLFGKDYRFSALAAGRHQLPMVTLSAILGGHVRVGLEDSLYAGPGKLATSSADQVRKIRSIIENLGLEIATPAEAREMLATKGGDNVAF